MQEGDLEESLISTIGGKGGKDLLIDAAEFSLDSAISDGVLKDIPVVGTVSKLYNVAIGVQGYVFAKKIRKFLVELKSISFEERVEFIKKLELDPKIRERTIDVLISFLDKLDDLEKAPLLARAFRGYIRGEYDLTTFQRLALAIDRCMVSDLRHIENMQKPIGLEGYVGDILVSCGLASVDTIPTIKSNSSQTKYVISDLGELFLQVVIKGLPRDE